MGGDATEELIRKAQLKATGADIHDVNGMIGYLVSVLDYMKNKRTHLPDEEVKRAFWNGTIVLSKYVEGEGTIDELKNKYVEKW